MGLFSGQVMVVTGASDGIGEAIARSLGEQGATVCLNGRDQKRPRDIVDEMPVKSARYYPADLTIKRSLQRLSKAILSDHKRVDALVHCAGQIQLDSVATGTVEAFGEQFQANVLGPYGLTQLLLPSHIAARGQVVFANSSAGRTARAGLSQYAATKHALRAVADSLREECNSSGVRVCSLFLGATATSMHAAVRAKKGRSYRTKELMQPSDVAAIVTAVLPLPRTAEVTDVMLRPMKNI